MQAVVVDHNARGDLALREVEAPVAGPTQALVRVAAISMNRGELRRAREAEAGWRIGWDLAGTVETAATDGSGPQVGARVVGFLPQGAWGQLAAVPTAALAELPGNVSFSQAATLPVAGLTALYVLEKNTGLLERRVLVTGANGGVGLFACRTAQHMGARVVGMVRRAEHVQMVRDAGAGEVIVSEDGAAAASLAPFRLIVESVGGTVLGNCLAMLGHDGVCVCLGASAGTESNFAIGPFMTAERASLYGFLLFNELAHEPASEGLERLAAMVSAGRLTPLISVEEPWKKVGDVAEAVWERRMSGKAVLHVS